MTRLAAVLAAALRDADPGSWGEAGGHWSLYPPAADRLVAAIPEPEREALEVGLLLAEVERLTADRNADINFGMDPMLTGSRWWAEAVWDEDPGYEKGTGPTLHAALTALLGRLVAP